MKQLAGLAFCLLVIFLLFVGTSWAEEEAKKGEKTTHNRVKRAFGYGRRRGYGGKGVVHKIIDEHNDHHDDYEEFNFFGNDHSDYGGYGHGGGGYGGGGGGYGGGGGGYGGGFDHYDYHGGDYHGGDYHGNDYHGGDYHGGDYHGGDYHGGDYHGGDYHGGDYHGDYGHYGGGGGYGGGDYHGGGGYGKRQPKYRVVPRKYGYKKVYKPKVVVIQKIVPLSTTTMPMGR